MQMPDANEMGEYQAAGVPLGSSVAPGQHPPHEHRQKLPQAMLLGRTAGEGIHRNRRAPSISGVNILISLDLVCCYVQPEMGTHKWNPVIRPRSGSCSSQLCHSYKPRPKRVIL